MAQRRSVLDLKHVSGSGIGARYAQGVKTPGGRRIPADIEITELTPGESIAFQTLTGPVRPRGRYVLAAFPCFAALGGVLTARPRLAVAVLAASACGLLLFTSAFARGYYIS